MVQDSKDLANSDMRLPDSIIWGADDRNWTFDPEKPYMGMSKHAYDIAMKHTPKPSRSNNGSNE
ncbi:hypothetical protein [Atopobium sp. oral taxon 810]|uniref:hypothetical protein n=1 Tax=Atopobium sp. oral taxon 810 TaxID=712158 RepID=UPI000396535F|nr:hypothetical protein [Atopobium sp. oral taxon 810]ERI05141.1 hypothetical protein HMPREF9069_01063 [Atopobium sp. oral taxon 810 str. F0209]